MNKVFALLAVLFVGTGLASSSDLTAAGVLENQKAEGTASRTKARSSEKPTLKIEAGASKSISSVAFSPDGRYVLTGSADKTARLWDLSSGRNMRRFKGHTHQVTSVAFSPRGKFVLTGSWDNTARLWDVSTGREVRRFEKGNSELMFISSVAFSPDGSVVAATSMTGTVLLWNAETGKEIWHSDWNSPGASIAFSPCGCYLFVGSTFGTVQLWDVKTGKEARRFEAHSAMNILTSVAYSPDGRYLLTGSRDKSARLWNAATGEEVRRFELEGDIDMIDAVAFSPDGRFIAAGCMNGSSYLLDIATGVLVRKFEKNNAGSIKSVAFSPDGRFLVVGSFFGTAYLWDAVTGKELASLVSLRGDGWAVIDPEGRFDSSNLEDISDLYWVMPDDPLKKLPIEIFMRDYYEPRLLARITADDKFEPVRALTGLNRVQPKVELAGVEPEEGMPDPQGETSNTVTVTVEVSGAERTYGRNERQQTRRTGVYELRLFRDQQLVGYTTHGNGKSEEVSYPENEDAALMQWRHSNEIKLDPETGKRRIKFEHIRLPRRTGVKDVTFSAYAFNEDRVKSQTARKKCSFVGKKNESSGAEPCILKQPSPRPGRVYVIAVGVNASESEDWDLHYAAKDAGYFSETLTPLLQGTKNYAEVVPISLISDWRKDESGQRIITAGNATKDKFKAVLDLLAGREAGRALLSGVPNVERLHTAQPDDLVLIAFSSHGYAGQSGIFYLFPYDIGDHAGKKINPALLRRSISSDELSVWMRDIDAGELVMIIDACHSAASVEGTGFKPGPMGSRGLGQLAYDKGMKILASTRADDAAWESPLIKQGLLSYALVQDGLVKKRADFAPEDKRIDLTEWLNYGTNRVPEIYAEMRSGTVKAAAENGPRLTSYRKGVGVDYDAADAAGKSTDIQQPSLFDFRRAGAYEPLITRVAD